MFINLIYHLYSGGIEEMGFYSVLNDVCQINLGHANLAVPQQVGQEMLSIIPVIHRRTC